MSDTSPSHHLPPEALETWLNAAAEELGIDPKDVSIRTLLDLARDAAHNVARPAAPLTTYLLGLAVARDERDDASALAEKAERLTQLALNWEA